MSETGFVPAVGGSLYFESDGDGPGVVLIHAGVANLRMWDPHVPALSEDFQVVRYDTRGFGRSESEHVEFSNRADLVAVLDHVGLDRAVVVGASRGGIIALDTVIEHPDRFSALVTVGGAVGGYDPGVDEDEAAWQEAERLWKAKEWEALAGLETRLWCDGPGQPEDRVDPALRELVHGWILSNLQAEKEEGLPQPLRPPAAERLGEVAIPVLVMIGSLDDPGTNASSRHLAASVPGARLVEYEGAAHMMSLEQPERFGEELTGFLHDVHDAGTG